MLSLVRAAPPCAVRREASKKAGSSCEGGAEKCPCLAVHGARLRAIEFRSSIISPERALGKSGEPLPTPIDLYFWPTPNGWKVSIMLEECGLPYRVRPINIARGRAVHATHSSPSRPNNRMPAIVDPGGPDGTPISVFESGAILQYLGRKTGKFYPAEERRRVAWRSGSTGRSAISGRWRARRIISACTHPSQIPYASPAILTSATDSMASWSGDSREHPFLAGADYTIADIACVGWTSRWQRQGQDPDQFPHVGDGSRQCARGPPYGAACRSASRKRQGRHERPRRSRRPVQSTGTVIAADYVVVAIPVPRFPIGFCAARTAMTRRFPCLTMRVARALLRPFTIGSSRRLSRRSNLLSMIVTLGHTWRAGARANHLGDGCTK